MSRNEEVWKLYIYLDLECRMLYGRSIQHLKVQGPQKTIVFHTFSTS
jgi:hypothetical protein